MAEPLLLLPDSELWLSPLPPSFSVDIKNVLPAFPVSSIPSLKLLIYLQRSEVDFMHELRADEAKERYLRRFFEVAEDVRRTLGTGWFDYFDPGSGVPMLSPGGPSIWSDVDTLQRCLKMEALAVGGCQVVRHHLWGFHCYPGVMLTTAGWEVVRTLGISLRKTSMNIDR